MGNTHGWLEPKHNKAAAIAPISSLTCVYCCHCCHPPSSIHSSSASSDWRRVTSGRIFWPSSSRLAPPRPRPPVLRKGGGPSCPEAGACSLEACGMVPAARASLPFGSKTGTKVGSAACRGTIRNARYDSNKNNNKKPSGTTTRNHRALLSRMEQAVRLRNS